MHLKNKIFSKLIGTSLALVLLGGSIFSISSKQLIVGNAYTASSLPTTIDLNAPSEQTIRNYYSDVNGKSGNNLLIALKDVLKDGQQYFSYDSGDSIWKIYEIADRDWKKSPATQITYGSYDSETNIITNYQYGSNSVPKNNPYVHALYLNRDVENNKKAWGSHGDRSDAATIEREHIWPKSHGFDSGSDAGARGDPMHLQAADGYVNGMHSNLFYGNVDKTKTFKDASEKFDILSGNLTGTSKSIGSGTVFEPQDSDKGDIARACFYMVARYNNLAGNDSTISGANPNLTLSKDLSENNRTGTSTQNNPYSLGLLQDLLEWNKLDPVDEYEINRNNLLYVNYTKNRNPFIDFPQWADIIWGSKSGSANPSTDEITKTSTDPVAVTGVSLNKNSLSVEKGGTSILVASVLPTNATNKSVTWKSSNDTVATVDNGVVTGVSEGSAIITVKTSEGGYTATCNVTVEKESPISSVYELSFKTNEKDGSNALDSNTILNQIATNDVAQSFSDLTKVFSGKSGIKLGSGDPGSMTFSLKNTVKKNKLSLHISTIKYGSEGNKFTVKINNEQVGNETIAGTEFSCSYSEDVPATSITISSTKRIYISKITIGISTSVVPVTDVSLDKSSLTLETGNTEQLTATVTPSDATNKNVSWSTSDDSIVEVDSEGNILACGVGTATVTVITDDGSFEDTCEVTVNAPTLTSISVDGTYPRLFFVGGEFLSNGLITTAHYSNGSEKEVEGIVTAPDMSTSGKKNVSVAYGGKSTFYQIDVIERTGALYTVSSYSSVTSTNAPEGSSATFNNTSNSKGTIYENKTATLTLSNYVGNKLNNIYLSMRSNKSSGAGYLVAKRGNTIIANIGSSSSPLPFSSEAWFGSYIDKYVNIKLDLSNIDQPIGSNEDITIQIFGTTNSLYIDSYIVDYEDVPDLTSITLSNITSVYSKGGSFVKPTVTAHYDDNTSRDVTALTAFTGNDLSSIGTKTVTASYEEYGITKTYNFDIVVQESSSSNKYELVNSINNLSAGDKILIVGIKGENYYALKPWVSGNNCKREEVSNPSNNIITTDASYITLGGLEDNWTLFDGTYYLYAAGGESDNNYLKGAKNADNLNAHWSISFSNNTAIIKTIDTTVVRHTIMNNNNNDLFSCYASGQAPVYIYKQTSSGPTDLQKAQQYAVNLTNSIVCYNGVQTPTISGTTWAELAESYNKLTSSVKSIFVNAQYIVNGSEVIPEDDTDQAIANAVAKYDQIVSRYSKTYSNFMGREIVMYRNPITQTFEKANSSVTVIVIASVLGISVTAGYIFYRKRKEQ